MGIVTATIGALVGLTGLSSYYLRHRISRNWIDYRHEGPTDLSDKGVFIITGGNTGLGYQVARDLVVRRKAHVVLACRNVEQGQEAAKSISKNDEEAAIDVLELDLGSLDSVKKFGNTIADKYPSVQALICNAGVFIPMDKNNIKTMDGFELHFGVNHLGHYWLIRTLLPHMSRTKSCPTRIVLVSSGLLKYGKLDLEQQDFVYEGRQQVEEEIQDDDDDSSMKKKNKHSSFAPTGYCDSKLMNALTCRHLACILAKESPHITTYATCPGFCRTRLARHVEFPLYKKVLLGPLMLLIQRTSVQGAQNILHAALKDSDTMISGEMYRDGEVATEESEFVESFGTEAPQKLWDLSEKLVNEKGGL